MVLSNDIDLLNPPAELEKRRHKLKRLVQSPNSFMSDCDGLGKICFNCLLFLIGLQVFTVCLCYLHFVYKYIT
ncbi:hypothetical protein MKW94_026676 [Papaver nudicaule]|uniref:Uncharacterized protein n=1 Tax=Papaver nudicaule TaxID=74823 RepID=A0AA41VZJ8_PAPNU|nr:hypothetical protein [Papaver nudicaule]